MCIQQKSKCKKLWQFLIHIIRICFKMGNGHRVAIDKNKNPETCVVSRALNLGRGGLSCSFAFNGNSEFCIRNVFLCKTLQPQLTHARTTNKALPCGGSHPQTNPKTKKEVRTNVQPLF